VTVGTGLSPHYNLAVQSDRAECRVTVGALVGASVGALVGVLLGGGIGSHLSSLGHSGI
jgi:outer membrane lipoprotein SlyB